MIHIYCGDGKGKTTAAMGLAARMAGDRKRVHIIQFLKGSPSGEIDFLASCRDTKLITVSRCDKDYGFFPNMSDTQKQEITQIHNKNLNEALSGIESFDMLILDEIFAALELGLADAGTVKQIMENCKNTELVLTGRNPDSYFLEKADYVSEIKKVKHPYDKGIKARKGIEF